MNRIFQFILFLVALGTGLFFLLLIGGTVLELTRTGFMDALEKREIFFAVRLSLITATIASTFAFLVSVPVAYLLSRNTFFGKNILDTILDLPIVLSPIAIGAMLLIFFTTGPGKLVNRFFGPFVFEVRGIILAQFMVVIGLSVRLMKNTFDGVDPEFEHLARTLGRNRFQTFIRVVIPLARRGLVSTFLMTWARAIGEFGATITLAGATTFKTETIPVAIFLNFESADISSALVFILILIGVSLGILFTLRKTRIFGYG